MTLPARALRLHIVRLTVDAAAGTDRDALARHLATQLPAAIAQRLQADAAAAPAPAALHERIAAAVAPRVAAQLEARR